MRRKRKRECSKILLSSYRKFRHFPGMLKKLMKLLCTSPLRSETLPPSQIPPVMAALFRGQGADAPGRSPEKLGPGPPLDSGASAHLGFL